MLDTGSPAPDFDLPGDDGKPIRLSDFKGRLVVVYFYPKDDTSGCTAQAKDFSCMLDEYQKLDAEVIGISPDTIVSHQKFRSKYGLTVHLAADEAKTAANLYGVWAEKSMYGKKYMGVERSTFLIDAEGKIVNAWRKVRVPGHAEEVLAGIRKLKGL